MNWVKKWIPADHPPTITGSKPGRQIVEMIDEIHDKVVCEILDGPGIRVSKQSANTYLIELKGSSSGKTTGGKSGYDETPANPVSDVKLTVTAAGKATVEIFGEDGGSLAKSNEVDLRAIILSWFPSNIVTAITAANLDAMGTLLSASVGYEKSAKGATGYGAAASGVTTDGRKVLGTDCNQ